MKRVLVLALAGMAFAYGQASFDPKANPSEDLKQALVEARQTHKRVLLDVGGGWCGWCHRMDRFLSENAELKALREKNYVLVKVNFSDENKNESFLKQYPPVKGYPHLFVLDETGRLLHSQDTGELEEGKGYNLSRFTAFLKKWAPGA